MLVFLTGQEEIEAACKQVYEISDRLDKKILVLHVQRVRLVVLLKLDKHLQREGRQFDDQAKMS